MTNVPWQSSAHWLLNQSGPSTNQTLWVFKTGGNIYSSPAVVNGVAYFGSYDGNVYAVGKLASSSGVPAVIYYVIAAVIVIIIAIAIAVVALRRRH